MNFLQFFFFYSMQIRVALADVEAQGTTPLGVKDQENIWNFRDFWWLSVKEKKGIIRII